MSRRRSLALPVSSASSVKLGLLVPAGFALVRALAGCGGDAARACNVNADCASGSCRSDGTCAPAPAGPANGGGPGGGGGGVGPGGGGEADGGAGSGDDAGGLASDAGTACVPNGDGVIERSEVAFVPGAHASFLVAEDVTVDTAGQTRPDGSRSWDFSAALAGDHQVTLDAEDPKGAWYASDFAGATFAAKLSDTQPLRGVYQVTNGAVTLMGVVSPAGGAQRTELTYSGPATVLQFPLKDGATWSTAPFVSGVAGGVPSGAAQTYDSQVDAHGTLVTPLATFQVLRVSTTVAGPGIYTRQVAFVTECFGTVAVVTSKNGETDAEFTNAAEIRRLAP